jgi:hypothetical protein
MFRGLRQQRHSRQSERPLVRSRASRCGVFATRDATALGVTPRPPSVTQAKRSVSCGMTLVTGMTQLPVGLPRGSRIHFHTRPKQRRRHDFRRPKRSWKKLQKSSATRQHRA